MYTEAETFLILKHGSIAEAYKAWLRMSYGEQVKSFNTPDYEILMEYEYNMQLNGPGPFEPR
jgi:hypothetical protein